LGLKVDSFDITCNQTIILQLRVNATLTGASYGNIQDSPSTESMIQYDTTATAMTGGIVIWTMLVTSSSGNTIQTSYSPQGIDFNVPEYQPVTVCSKMLTGKNNYLASMVMRLREEY
jgi:hypothetical protein